MANREVTSAIIGGATGLIVGTLQGLVRLNNLMALPGSVYEKSLQTKLAAAHVREQAAKDAYSKTYGQPYRDAEGEAYTQAIVHVANITNELSIINDSDSRRKTSNAIKYGLLRAVGTGVLTGIVAGSGMEVAQFIDPQLLQHLTPSLQP